MIIRDGATGNAQRKLTLQMIILALNLSAKKTKNTDGNVKDPEGDDYDCDYDDDVCDDYDDDNDQNANLVDNAAKCVAHDTAYKFGKKDSVISKEKGVASFQQCQLNCAEESECKYWKFKKNGKCILSRNIKKKNFVKNKPGVTSGTILNGCKPNTNTEQSTETSTENSSELKDYCVEYGATYNGGNQISVLKNIDNAELCRQECLKTGGCSYYTYNRKVNKRGQKKKKCILKSAASLEELDVTRKKYSIAGSVVGRCRGTELSDADVCHCVKIKKKNSNNSNANGRTSVVNSRINPNAEVEEFFVGQDGSLDQETFLDDSWTLADILGKGVQRNDNTKCRKGNVKRCKSNIDTNEELNQLYERGEYCVDYNVRYEDGDAFKVVGGVGTAQECRFECLATQRSDGCRFYSWSATDKKCYLMNEELWIPTIEKDAVSGTLDGLCKTQSFGQLGECECQTVEVYDEYYDEPDLVATGLIDVRSGDSIGCPEDQGKRCYARVAITTPSSDSRAFLRGILPDADKSDAVVFG